MTRPDYLTENFYTSVQKELKKNNSDYEKIQKRNDILSRHQKEREYYDQIGMELLKSFGAM